jgi:hypothetical protein
MGLHRVLVEPCEINPRQFARLRRLCGLGILGSVGVTGIVLGGVFAGRIAACLASASVTYALVAPLVLGDDVARV